MQTKQIQQLQVGDTFTWAFHEHYQVTDIKPSMRKSGGGAHKNIVLLSYIGMTTGTTTQERSMPKASICEFIGGTK
jgi:hypothetical protein